MTRGCTFETFDLTMLGADFVTPINLTGFTVYAEVRLSSGSPVIIDLAPTISSAIGGVVTIPEINDETTATYVAGSYQWDLLLEETATDNMQRILTGSFTIQNKITLS